MIIILIDSMIAHDGDKKGTPLTMAPYNNVMMGGG